MVLLKQNICIWENPKQMSGKWTLLLASNFNHHLILYLDSAFILVAHFVLIVQRSFIIFKAILYLEIFTELLVYEDARTIFLSHFCNTDFKPFLSSLYLKDPHFTSCSTSDACLFHWKNGSHQLGRLWTSCHQICILYQPACYPSFFLGYIFIYLFIRTELLGSYLTEQETCRMTWRTVQNLTGSKRWW